MILWIVIGFSMLMLLEFCSFLLLFLHFGLLWILSDYWNVDASWVLFSLEILQLRFDLIWVDSIFLYFAIRCLVWFGFPFCFAFTCILALWALRFVFRVDCFYYLFSVALWALRRAFSSFETLFYFYFIFQRFDLIWFFVFLLLPFSLFVFMRAYTLGRGCVPIRYWLKLLCLVFDLEDSNPTGMDFCPV